MTNPFAAFFPGRRPRRRDYAGAKQSAENPLFTKESRASLGGPLAILMLFLLIGGGVALLLLPQFRVTTVAVEGGQKLDASSVERFVARRLDRTTLGIQWRRVRYLLPAESVRTELRASIEQRLAVNSVALNIEGSRLTVTISERTPSIIWQAGRQDFFALDDQGVIVERIVGDPAPTLPVLVDVNDLPAEIGTTVVLPRLVSGLQTVQRRLPDLSITPSSFETWAASCQQVRAPDFPPSAETDELEVTENVGNQSLVIPQPETDCDPAIRATNEPTLVVITDEGWTIRFDVSGDLDAQLQKLDVALRQRLRSVRDTLRYIDVRYGDRVFYQ